MTGMGDVVDVVVVGAGMGGLVAATAAAEEGARVELLEKGPEPGGSMALAGGYVWTMPSFEKYRELVPLGDPTLGRLVVEDFETGIAWLRNHGVRFGPLVEGFGEDGVGVGYRIEPDTVSSGVTPLADAFKAAGGKLSIGTTGVALLAGHSDGVAGVVSRSSGRSTREIRASAVVLATGGFQGDVDLVTRYITPWADRLYLRSNPRSTGDGFHMATAVGVGASAGLSAFYGHLLPAPPTRIVPALFRVLAQFYSPHAILLNREGRRFTDESRGDAFSALALSRQPEAMGVLVFDDDCHHAHVAKSHLPDMPDADPLNAIRTAGGVVVSAGTLAELAGNLAELGLPASVAEATMRTYDRAAVAGTPAGLETPRRANLHRLVKAPFHAVPVRSGITFTEGGLRVDETCQALDRDGRQVHGLYIAGVDVGGISYEGYAGGLAASLVTGLRAGIHAARARLD